VSRHPGIVAKLPCECVHVAKDPQGRDATVAHAEERRARILHTAAGRLHAEHRPAVRARVGEPREGTVTLDDDLFDDVPEVGKRRVHHAHVLDEFHQPRDDRRGVAPRLVAHDRLPR